MDMIDIARRDAQFMTSSKTGGFAIDVVLTDRESVQASITALCTKRHLRYDLDRAAEIDSKLAHLSFSEAVLIAAAPTYTLRNSEGSVHMLNHRVTWTDSTGVEYTYRIKEWHGNETLGVVVCLLEDFRAE